MKHSRRSSRVLSGLSDSVHLRLNMYALLQAPPESEHWPWRDRAKRRSSTRRQVTIRINKTIPLDLNHDGKTDFRLPNVWCTPEAPGVGWSEPQK